MRCAAPRPLALFFACVVVAGCGTPRVPIPKTDPRYEFEVGRAEFGRRHYLEAQTHFKSFLAGHPGHAVADSAQLLLGLSMFEAKSYAEAAVEFGILSREYPRSDLRDDAAYHECRSYAMQMRSPQLDPTFATRARSCLQEFMIRFPDSDLHDEAEARLAEIDDRLAEKEFRLGVLFAKMKRPAAARVYLEGLLQTYPKSRWVPEAMYWIGRSKEVQLDPAGAVAAYRELQESFPTSKAAQEAANRQRELLHKLPQLGAPAPPDSLARP